MSYMKFVIFKQLVKIIKNKKIGQRHCRPEGKPNFKMCKGDWRILRRQYVKYYNTCQFWIQNYYRRVCTRILSMAVEVR